MANATQDHIGGAFVGQRSEDASRIVIFPEIIDIENGGNNNYFYTFKILKNVEIEKAIQPGRKA
jgi:hypothetical protein